MKKHVLVLDIDGTLTSGLMYYTAEGKHMKAFGPYDHTALKEISKHMDVHFISADSKGFAISKKRVVDEMKFPLDLVPEEPKLRWNWIRNRFPDKEIIFIGDGISDYCSLREAKFSACPVDSLDHVKDATNYISSRRGGDRFVADAIIEIVRVFELKAFME